MEGAERAQEASGGSGGEASRLQRSGDTGCGGAVVWVAGVDERPVTAVEPSQRRCVGGMYCCRGGGHRVCACLEPLFRISKERGRAPFPVCGADVDGYAGTHTFVWAVPPVAIYQIISRKTLDVFIIHMYPLLFSLCASCGFSKMRARSTTRVAIAVYTYLGVVFEMFPEMVVSGIDAFVGVMESLIRLYMDGERLCGVVFVVVPISLIDLPAADSFV